MAISNLFNVEWYLNNNPDVRAAVEAGLVDAETHFMLHGRFEGRSPSPSFDPAYYLARNPDVRAAVEAGLVTAYDHFLLHGASEARPFVAFFDVHYYLDSNPDVRSAVGDDLEMALTHFLTHGQSETRAISPFFDLRAYLDANPDVAAAVENGAANALDHLLNHGFAEGRPLGNGVSLEQFANDPTFKGAADALAALARVAEVAPFIPSFEPPAGWTPPADLPIPTDFVPRDGEKLKVPPTVKVPDGVKLPDAFEPVEPGPQPEPEPDPQPDPTPGPVRSFKATLDSEDVISFKSTNLSGDVSVTLTESGDNYIATFTRGTKDSAVTISKDDLPNVRLDWADIGIANFKPGAGTVLIRNPSEGDGTKGALAATIQGGVDASAVDGTVLVGAGTYTEQVVINKKGIQLLGPNAGINPNDGARTNEALLRPERDGKTGVQYVVTFTSEANDGVLDGFALQGDRNNGVYTQSMQSGISVESDGTKIVNNIVDDFNYLGVRVNNFTYDADTAKWTIHLVQDVEVANNRISNVLLEPDNSDSVGHAIYYQGALGTIHGNTILNSETGIQVQPYGKNYNPDLYGQYEGETPVVSDNTIEAAYRGIWLNYAQDDAPQWEVRGNTITATDGQVEHADWQGIWVQTFEGGNGFDVRGNTIDGKSATVPSSYGVRFTGIKGGSDKLDVSANTLINVDSTYYNDAGGVTSFSKDGDLSLFSHIQDAVTAAMAKEDDIDEVVLVGPKDFKEGVIVNSLSAGSRLTVKSEGNQLPKIDADGKAYGVRAEGADFEGVLIVEGLEVLAGSQGGIGQYMSASAGTIHVLNNVVSPSAGSFALHGNAIQISGKGSTVIGNEVTVAEYLTEITNWSTSGVTVVKDASSSFISQNTIKGPQEGIGPHNSVTGIAVDGKYTDDNAGLVEVSVIGNKVSNLSSGISLSDHVEVTVQENLITANTNGIALGITSSGWEDAFNVTITGNKFQENGKAIAIYDFDAGGIIRIEENKFDADDMVEAIWLNGSGEYNDASIIIDLAQFSTDSDGLAMGVISSSGDHLTNIKIDELADDEFTVTWSNGAFQGLTIVLTGASGYKITDIEAFLGVEIIEAI